MVMTIRKLLLTFLRWSAYQETMNPEGSRQDRPDIVAAIRGGDDSLGMEGEADPVTASLEQALFWRNIYTEILAMEEAVLARIQQLMADQSPQARREVELTNVPVVVAQAERFRSRLGLPVRFVGVGEKVGDLLPFDPKEFVDSLFE
jgi:hypothetical protein